jgi:hypothetical protein
VSTWCEMTSGNLRSKKHSITHTAFLAFDWKPQQLLLAVYARTRNSPTVPSLNSLFSYLFSFLAKSISLLQQPHVIVNNVEVSADASTAFSASNVNDMTHYLRRTWVPACVG